MLHFILAFYIALCGPFLILLKKNIYLYKVPPLYFLYFSRLAILEIRYHHKFFTVEIFMNHIKCYFCENLKKKY
jgi:hypothetical protein